MRCACARRCWDSYELADLRRRVEYRSRGHAHMPAGVKALLFACAVLAAADEPSPDALVRRISDEVLAALRQDADLRAGDARKITALVEAKILPHFDFERTTRIALGPNWRLATPEQRGALTREFRTLLVRTYSGALAGYRDQTIEVRPPRMRPGDLEVTVRTQIRQAGAEPVVIEYDMQQSATGWKLFDVRVAGISLVATYRSAFAEEVRNHGIDGLIETLAAKNRSTTKVSTRN
jgi:phospholipid transport system substrate-binding protein